jgi:hypothetical protein
MPGQRHTTRPRTRGSSLPRLAGLGVIVVLAVGGATAYLVAFHPSQPKRPPPLPSRVTSTQTVGLVARPTAGSAGPDALVQLLIPQRQPSFDPVGLSQQQQGQPQWIADVMAGGSYIFIYLPTSQCLTATGPAAHPQLTVQHCNLSPQQRWSRLGTGVLSDAHDFYQFSNLAAGKCITEGSGSAALGLPASLTTCDPAKPASQLIAFWWTSG